MSTFRAFLESQYPGAWITGLSESNNAVYLVRSQGEVVVAKHVTDTDIPLGYLAESSARLGELVPVQRIHRVYETERGDPFDAVLAEYVEGTDLATVLGRGEPELPPAELAAFLGEFVVACRQVPRMHDGFGLYKRDAPVIDTHPEFVAHYARRYWGRARPFYEGTPVGDAVQEWLDGGLVEALRAHPAPYDVVPVDANLKNFVVTPDGRIVVLNVPIAGVSTPAQAVAAISAHLRHHKVHEVFLESVEHGICKDDFALVPHFELWALLGILSFYAVREPDRRGEWRDWGSPALLDEDFTALAGSLLRGSGTR